MIVKCSPLHLVQIFKKASDFKRCDGRSSTSATVVKEISLRSPTLVVPLAISFTGVVDLDANVAQAEFLEEEGSIPPELYIGMSLILDLCIR